MVPMKTKKRPRATERATMVIVLGDAMEPLGTGPGDRSWELVLARPSRSGCQPGREVVSHH